MSLSPYFPQRILPMHYLAVLALLGSGGLSVPAAVTIDGNIGDLGAPCVRQTISTALANNENELDDLYCAVSCDRLYVGVSGNIRGNNLVILLDSQPGQGEEFLAGNGTNTSGFALQMYNLNGNRFDCAMDYALVVQSGGASSGEYYASLFDLDLPGGSDQTFLGVGTLGGTATTHPGTAITHALNIGNTDGVSQGTGCTDPNLPRAFLGFEASIPLSVVGNDGSSPVRLVAFIVHVDGTFANQFLPPLPCPGGTQGALGKGPFDFSSGNPALHVPCQECCHTLECSPTPTPTDTVECTIPLPTAVVVNGDMTDMSCPCTRQTISTALANNENELDDLYSVTSCDRLYLGVTGNIRGNDMVILLDSKPGGETVLAGNGTDTSGFSLLMYNLRGNTFDCPMDYALVVQSGGSSSGQYFPSLFDLAQPGGSDQTFLGVGALGGAATTHPGTAIRHALRIDNTVGVAQGTACSDPNFPPALTGFEVSIPLSVIGAGAEPVRMVAFIVSTDGTTFANQFLPPLPCPGGTQGGLGAGPFDFSANNPALHLPCVASCRFLECTPTPTASPTGTCPIPLPSAIPVNGDMSDLGCACVRQTISTSLQNNDNELDDLYSAIVCETLHLGITGNIRGNDLVVLFDSREGQGETTISGNGSNTGGFALLMHNLAGNTFDCPLDYALVVQSGGSTSGVYFASLFDLALPGGSDETFLGTGALGGATTTHDPTGIRHALRIDNTAGVGSGIGCGDANFPPAIYGFEAAIPLSAIGAAAGDSVRMVAFIVSTDGTTFANQFLPPLPCPGGVQPGLGVGPFNFSAANPSLHVPCLPSCRTVPCTPAGTPTDTPLVPPTATPTNTSTATRTPTNTPTADVSQAVLSGSIASGDPCADETFGFGVSIANNTFGTVGTYALLVSYDAAQLELLSIADGGLFGVAPLSSGPEGAKIVSALNALSNLVNGPIFTMSFRVRTPGNPGPISFQVADSGPTPLYTTAFNPIPHRFDVSAVTGLCGPSPTATPTSTPTGTGAPPTATPTNTPTRTSTPTFTVAPPTHTPTNTPTGAPTRTPTNTPDASLAVVSAVVSAGDPCLDESFAVDAILSNNTVGTLGTYAFRVTYNPAQLAFVGAVDGGQFGVPPLTSGAEGSKAISQLNALSTLQNGLIFTMTFSVLSPGSPGAITIALADNGPTPLYTTAFDPIPHRYDTSGVTGLCAGPTATPTDTPPAQPTDTPAPTFVWGDVSGDQRPGTVDASLILQWDAFLIDEFPGYPGIVRPSFPAAADTSGEGVLGALDAAQILQLDAFLRECFTADANCDGFGPED